MRALVVMLETVVPVNRSWFHITRLTYLQVAKHIDFTGCHVRALFVRSKYNFILEILYYLHDLILIRERDRSSCFKLSTPHMIYPQFCEPKSGGMVQYTQAKYSRSFVSSNLEGLYNIPKPSIPTVLWAQIWRDCTIYPSRIFPQFCELKSGGSVQYTQAKYSRSFVSSNLEGWYNIPKPNILAVLWAQIWRDGTIYPSQIFPQFCELKSGGMVQYTQAKYSRSFVSSNLEGWYNIPNYNMTVWHFGPCVTFWPCLCDISARLVWHFGPLVRNEGKRVSPYPHINHWRRL